MSDNPYHPAPDDNQMAPFAGRQAEFTRFDHYLKDPVSQQALAFLGRRWLGKTALLRRFDTAFGDSVIGAYFPLGNVDLESEASLLSAVVEGVGYYLTRRDVTTARIPQPKPGLTDWRSWMLDEWLPEIQRTLRTNRKLVLLFDDVQHWLAMEEASDSMTFFQQILSQNSQIKLVLTLAAENEDQLPLLSPLVNTADVMRLPHLSIGECTWLLRTPATGHFSVTDDGAAAVYQTTSGHPQLLQRFGHHLYNYAANHPAQPTITPEIVKSLLPAIYRESNVEMTQVWQRSPDNQRLVLMAVSDLHYQDPLAKINTESVGEWAVESGYVLDRTGINAALRSLEYRELITLRGDHITLNSGLLQMWLLDNARRMFAQQQGGTRRIRPALFAAGALVVIVVIALILSLSNTPQPASSSNLAPTITLAGE